MNEEELTKDIIKRFNEEVNIDFQEGFQKGKLEERERIKEIINNWSLNSVLTFDDDSIKQTEIINKIVGYVKQLQKEIGEEKGK